MWVVNSFWAWKYKCVITEDTLGFHKDRSRNQFPRVETSSSLSWDTPKQVSKKQVCKKPKTESFIWPTPFIPLFLQACVIQMGEDAASLLTLTGNGKQFILAITLLLSAISLLPVLSSQVNHLLLPPLTSILPLFPTQQKNTFTREGKEAKRLKRKRPSFTFKIMTHFIFSFNT